MTARKTGTALYRNPMSYLGVLVMGVTIALIVFLLLVSLAAAESNPYLGIIIYLVLPVFLVVGGILFLWGMRRESLRRRRLGTTEAQPYPRLDLNDPAQRMKFAQWLVLGTLGGVLVAYVGYNGFLFTESVTFCGEVCHTVMEPEYTAYLNGPHARVRCVECHVGEGVNWYVKSKLSGVRQVFAVALNSYERPIPVPVKELRPARETCEECHWPEKFFGAQLIQNPHFRYDRENTPEQISLLVKTGGGSPRMGQSSGIHWHMVIDNDVWFRPADAAQQTIPWFKVRRRDGTEDVYVDPDSGLTEQELEALPQVLMDCMHCHNRPSHVFQPPEVAVDRAMLGHEIPRDLPWIKKVAVDALVPTYETREAAHAGIRQGIEAFYRKEGLMDGRRTDVDRAITAVLAIYDRNVFPKMNVDWKTYPSNLGHRNWPGCFRCHDGRHVSTSGKVLLKDACTDCHTMPQRGPLVPLGGTAPASEEDWHPWPLEGRHAEILCSQCHEAGFRPPTQCISCHGFDAEAPMMTMGCDTCHLQAQRRLPLAGCGDCHQPAGLHEVESHQGTECITCHPPHGWQPSARGTCLECHDDLKDHYAPEACAECHDFRP